MSILFECKDLRKNYGKNQALKGLNLQIESGQIVGLLGPNGSGKTTLIKLANGLLTKNGGELYIDGKEVGVETKKVVSYLPERTYLDVHSKVKMLLNFSRISTVTLRKTEPMICFQNLTLILMTN